jgi:predicted acylesterase/phospholipase RssA
MLSTVSGGSITGALYALRCAQEGDGAPGSYPVDDLIEEVKELTTQNLRRNALLSSPKRVFQTIGSFFTQKIRRMPLLVDEMDRQVFGEARLSDAPDWIVINATNLMTGKRWKFFSDRMGDYRVGATEKTEDLPLAGAVGASAAYPLLTDPYPLKGRWEEYRGEPLSKRWRRPTLRRSGEVSRWRRRYGEPSGDVTFPLVDGGFYDNLGLNSLRSMQVDYAIYSSAATASSAYDGGWIKKDLERAAFSMHSRLGAVTRMHAHEMTHKIKPAEAKDRLEAAAAKLRQIGGKLPDEVNRSTLKTLGAVAENLEEVGQVDWPPRGPQYTATAPIILRNTDLGRGRSPYDLPEEQQGLVPQLVKDLARVRTDLDAHSPDVVDLLIAQGYFLANACLIVGTPELISQAELKDESEISEEPAWAWAYQTIEKANANEKATQRLLTNAQDRSGIFGRTLTPSLDKVIPLR